MQARRDIPARIAALDREIRSIATRHAAVRLLMTVPGVGPIAAMAFVTAFDDASRFRRSSSVGACPGLTPRRYDPGEISRNGRVSTHLNNLAGVVQAKDREEEGLWRQSLDIREARLPPGHPHIGRVRRSLDQLLTGTPDL